MYDDAVRRASDAESSVKRYVSLYRGRADLTVAKLCRPHAFLPADYLVVALIRHERHTWVKLFIAQPDSLWVMSAFSHPYIHRDVFDVLMLTQELPKVVDCGENHFAFRGHSRLDVQSEQFHPFDVCIVRDPDTWDYRGSLVWAEAAAVAA